MQIKTGRVPTWQETAQNSSAPQHTPRAHGNNPRQEATLNMLQDPRGGIWTHQESNTTVRKIIAITPNFLTSHNTKDNTLREQPPARKQHKKHERGKLSHMMMPANNNNGLESDFAQKLRQRLQALTGPTTSGKDRPSRNTKKAKAWKKEAAQKTGTSLLGY